MKPRKIAILSHEIQPSLQIGYLVDTFAEFWREDGHEVIRLHGTRRFVPADLLIVHVDLSVVPEEYLAFARRYPVVLNAEAKDIRKSSYSRLRVYPGDAYDGPVIVKSNFNYAGLPERVHGQREQVAGRVQFPVPLAYRVHDKLAEVPRFVFDQPNLIVEKFLPEFEDGHYHMRALTFLGNRYSCTRMSSKLPIVNGSSIIHVADVEPHPDIIALKRAAKFDYGKFDYVMHQGQATLLDMNKTVGAPPPTDDPQILAGRRYRAQGLYEFFESGP